MLANSPSGNDARKGPQKACRHADRLRPFRFEILRLIYRRDCVAHFRFLRLNEKFAFDDRIYLLPTLAKDV